MATVLIYLTRVCPYCHMAMRLLDRKGLRYDLVYVDDAPDRRDEMVRRAGRTTIPQIFIGDVHVGGYRELAALDLEGKLDALTARAS